MAPWRKGLARLQSIGIDAVLIATLILMAELLVVAFSGRRGATGLLLTAEQILDLLHAHVEFPDQGHDLVTGDVPTLLADLKQILDVHDGPDVDGDYFTFSLHGVLLS